MKLLLCFVAVLASCSAGEFSKGLRAVVFYTYDKSFAGADVHVQELDSKLYEELHTTKKFYKKTKELTNAHEFLHLLDDRCDFEMKCEKYKIPVVDVCPTPKPCQKCTICSEEKECFTTPTTRTTSTTRTTTRTTTPVTKSTTTSTGTTTTPVTKKTSTTTRTTTPVTQSTSTSTRTTTTPVTKKTSTSTTTKSTTTGQTVRTYIPVSYVSRPSHGPWTGTYKANTGTYVPKSQTWRPFTNTATYTFNPRTYKIQSYKITPKPLYSDNNHVNGFQYNN